MRTVRYAALAAFAAVSLALVGGCASEDILDEEGSENVDLLTPAASLNLDNQALAIAVSDMATRPLEGFDSLLGQTTGKRCIDTSNITFKAGAVTTATAITLDYVESQTALAAQLGVSLTSGAFSTTPQSNSVSTPAGLAYSFNKSSSSANFLLKAKATWQLSANKDGQLKKDYADLLQSNPDRFLLDCGGFFISKVMYEANVYALITFTRTAETSSMSLQQQVSGELGLKFGSKSMVVTAGVNAELSKVKSNGELKYSMVVATSGFLPGASVPTSALAGAPPFDFQNKVFAQPDLGSQINGLSGLVSTMSQSLQTDITALSSRVAPDQTQPNSVLETMLSQPSYVRLSRYSHVAPSVTADMWDSLYSRLQKSASAYSQGQALYDEMSYRHNEEINRLLEDRGNGHLYAMPNDPHGGSEATARAIAIGWKGHFAPANFDSLNDPESVSSGGSAAIPLAKALRRCAIDFDLGKYDSCGNNASLISAIGKGRFLLNKYKSRRVAHLRIFDLSTDEMSWDDAMKRCGTALGPEATLPVKEDVAKFGPLLGNLGGKVWYRSNSSCKRRVYSTPTPDECDDGTAGTGLFGLHEHAFACTPATGSVFADYSSASLPAPGGF